MNYSRQREAVLSDLRARKDHPTAAAVCESVRKRCPDISLATVYRNLTSLCESGKALRFTADGAERFDGNTSAHLHFVCEGCGAIYDVFSDYDFAVRHSMNDAFPGITVRNVSVTASGFCEKCSKDITNSMKGTKKNG